MADPQAKSIADYFNRSHDVIARIAGDTRLLADVAAIAERIAQALRAGGKLMIAGNGGSAADAQHIAAEMLSRFVRDRHPLPALALTTDTSVLTAIGNDYGFDAVFERQVRGLGHKGDVLLAISTSGRSPNIHAAIKAARDMGIATIAFTGAKGSTMASTCDLAFVVPSDEVALIQQAHLVAAHAICGIVEGALADSASPR